MPNKKLNILSKAPTTLLKNKLTENKNSSVVTFTLPDPQPGKQAEFVNTTADVCIYGGGAGSGKAQFGYGLDWAFRNIPAFTVDKYYDIIHLIPKEIRDMDSKVLMWNGEWKGFSEVAVGDRIMNPDGQAQEIIQIHERGNLQVYKVTFEDKTSVECSGDHLWGFWEAGRDSRRKTREGKKLILDNNDETNWNINYISRARVRDTEWLFQEMQKNRRFIIPIAAPLNYTHISRGREDRAYLYGVLLGDGMIQGRKTDGIGFCTADIWIQERCLPLLEKYKVRDKSRESQQTYFAYVDVRDDWVRNWAVNSGLMGKYSHDKFIPKGYLKESLGFRWNLAQGLFDTDGYAATSATENNEVSYCTVSPELAEDVAILVRSLGFIAKIRQKQGVCYSNGYEGEKRMSYIVSVEGNDRHRLFSLPRKIESAMSHEPNIWVGKAITNIEKLNKEVYCRCITVSNPNSLYITDGYNVTHNSWALLRKSLTHIQNPDYGAVIFRRTSPEITTEGGLWDESKRLFHLIPGAIPREGKLDWKFPSGAAISFGHAQHEKDVENKFPGAQIAYIGFDELNKFTEKQFWFLFSRNRSTCGVKPRIDATCNPDADSWVAKLIDWWICPTSGYPIPERSGVLRYFYRLNNVIHWGDSAEELMFKFPDLAKVAPPKSLTFISATLDDNKILLTQNPDYKANLLSLLNVDMERLLKGNWKIKWSAGLVFNRSWFQIIDQEDLPTDLTGAQFLRFWDLASTAKEVALSSSCFSASQKWMKVKNKFTGESEYYILDVYWEQLGAEEGDNQIVTMAVADGKKVKQRWELEGGSASRRHEQSLIKAIKKALPECSCKGVQPLGDKLTRAKPWAMDARAGKIKILRAWWNDDFLSALDSFDGSRKTPPINDIVDGGSGAHSCLSQNLVFGGNLS